jgi:hypothetical protein
MQEKAFVIEWADVPIFGAAGTCHFEVVLYESGAIKFVYKDIPPAFAVHAPPSAGIQNAAGNEGISTSFGAPPEPNTAVMIGDSCGSTQTVLSIGFCPGAWGDVAAGTGGAPTGVADPSGASHCTFDFADDFCYTTYGGQLSSLSTQYEYDQLVALANGVDEHYMLGLHSDGAGNWEFTDGSPADMDFLRAHSNDNLEGVAEDQMVFHPSSGLNDCCGSWQIHGFVCEHYAAPDTFIIGLNRAFSDAESFCQTQYNGHLASVHTQTDYDTLMTMSTGYTLPILIGGRLDDGEWSWSDGSFFDEAFVMAHSWDQLGSGSPDGEPAREQESQMVLYPPICDEAWNGGGDVQGCNTPEEVAEHSNHAIHSWGMLDDQAYAFVCSTAGSDYHPPMPPPPPPIGGGH